MQVLPNNRAWEEPGAEIRGGLGGEGRCRRRLAELPRRTSLDPMEVSQARVGGTARGPSSLGAFFLPFHLGSQCLLVTKLHKNPGLLPPSSRHDDVSNPRLGFQKSDHSRYPKEEKEQPRNGSAEERPRPTPVSPLCPPCPGPGRLGRGQGPYWFSDSGRRGCVLEAQQVPVPWLRLVTQLAADIFAPGRGVPPH